MDEIIVNQIKYISSKRASAATGYAKDYVGQLVRQGKVDARKVGRSWYVNELQILKHSGKELQGSTAPANSGDFRLGSYVAPTRPKITHPHQIESAIKKSWSDIKYFQDDEQIMPISDNRDTKDSNEISIYKAKLVDGAVGRQNSLRVSNTFSTVPTQVSVHTRTVDGIQRQSDQEVVVLSRETAQPTKYVDSADFSRQWRYKSIITTLFAAAVALLMPVIL